MRTIMLLFAYLTLTGCSTHRHATKSQEPPKIDLDTKQRFDRARIEEYGGAWASWNGTNENLNWTLLSPSVAMFGTSTGRMTKWVTYDDLESLPK